MRVAALYDIHGNLPALEAVLRDVRDAGVEGVVVGGDVVPGPMPRESLDLLSSLDVPTWFIRGNGEREIGALAAGVETGTVPEKFRGVMAWVADQLGSELAGLVEAWPETLRLSIPGLGDVLFCHATPRTDSELFTRVTPVERLLPVFEPAAAAVVVCGHTHMQFDRRIGSTRVVNAGSVGMPFGDPGAYWLIVGPSVESMCTPYDFAEAAARVRASGYPQADDFAERNVLRPPGESEMVELFERAALR